MRTCLSILAFIMFLQPGILVGAQTYVAKKVNGNETIRFGFIRTIMGSINENDAKAAIHTWTKSLTRELNLPVDPETTIYSALSEIKKALEENRVDVLYATIPQWFAFQHLIAEDALIAIEQSGKLTEEYLLLVHRDNPVREVRELKGMSLRVLDNARTALGRSWLTAFLAEERLGSAGAHFKDLKMLKKINDTLLPVFFKQADACLVDRNGFDTMAELNPQIARQMKVVAASSPYFPLIFCFRKAYQSRVKQMILDDIQKMVESASGAQLLTIFQMDGMQQISIADLADTISLLEKAHALSGGAESGKFKVDKK